MSPRNVSRIVIAVALVVGLPMQLEATIGTPDAGLRAADLSAAPSKVCHPKKPTACRAEVLASLPAQAVEMPTAPEVKQAMVCVGPRWICRTPDLSSVTESIPEVSPEPQPESTQAMVCVGPRWICRADSVL